MLLLTDIHYIKHIMYIPYTLKMKEDFKTLLNFTDIKEDAHELIKLRYLLNYTGFEIYITEFFKKEKYGFKTYHNGGMDDKGIDIKGIRKGIDGKEEYLIIQCKKWYDNNIKLNDITSWYGKVVEHRKYENLYLVFVTTAWCTENAKKFCEDKLIYLLDYKQVIEMTKEWKFEDFEKFIESSDNNYKKEDLFSIYYLQKLEWYEKNYIENKEEYFKKKIQTKRESIENRHIFKKSIFTKIKELIGVY